MDPGRPGRRTAGSRASPSCRSHRWDGVSSPDGSPRPTTCHGTTSGAGCRASQHDALHANLAIVERVREVARRVPATPAQVALAWVLAQGGHVVPIPGTKTPRYLTDNAGAADVELSAADLAELDALPEPQGARY